MKALLLCALCPPLIASAQKKIWTDPADATAENPDFLVQGEYTNDGWGAQVVALGDAKFQIRLHKGGLPGAGWDESAPLEPTYNAESYKNGVLTLKESGELKRIERKSPTLGKAAPAEATLLFSGRKGNIVNRFTSKTETKGEETLLCEGGKSQDKFGSFQLHLEFRLPFKPHTKPGSQDRGNSGLYTFHNYETQILDSFGIKPAFNFCGSLYRFKTCDINMCLPPLAWQTYDVDFTAAEFDPKGAKTKNARITVKHNGVTIHDDVELPKGTGAGGKRPEKARGELHLQGHGNPVRFRNIWIIEKT